MTESRQLNTSQHSYRPHHSTTTALCQLTDTLYEATDNNLISVLLSVDQSSMFDNVSHGILLRKLQQYNIEERTVEWFREYRYRSECVEIGNKRSQFQRSKKWGPSGVDSGAVTVHNLH